jgi:hypothetical protein
MRIHADADADADADPQHWFFIYHVITKKFSSSLIKSVGD